MKYSAQPILKPELQSFDLFLEGIALLFLLALFLFPVLNYSSLPDVIPRHFNLRGEADGFGQKGMLWVLPGLGLCLYALLTLLNRKPHVFNYPVKITEENALQQYTMATRLIRLLKAFVLLLFSYITWEMIRGAMQQELMLDRFFLPVLLTGVFGILGWYLYAAMRKVS